MSNRTAVEQTTVAADFDPEPPAEQHRKRWEGWRRFTRNPAALAGLILFTVILFTALDASQIAPLIYHPTPGFAALFAERSDPGVQWRAACAAAVTGALPTLAIGLMSAMIATAIGTCIGASGGYYGGWIDALLGGLTDLTAALPFLPLTIALIIATRRPQGVVSLIVIFGAVGWVTSARLVRSAYLVLREEGYAEAARASGIRSVRIIFRHLLPLALPQALVAATLAAGSFMLAEATLDFLTVGVTGLPTWGSQINAGQSLMAEGRWAGTIVPGLGLWLTLLALNLISEGVRDALDVRERLR